MKQLKFNTVVHLKCLTDIVFLKIVSKMTKIFYFISDQIVQERKFPKMRLMPDDSTYNIIRLMYQWLRKRV